LQPPHFEVAFPERFRAKHATSSKTHSGAKVQKRRAIYACALILQTLLALTQLSYSAASKLTIVPRAKLCVTEGTMEESPGGELIVSVPKMRAYANAFTSQLIEAHVTFSGSTGHEARLGSGELRRQFGLKLRAQDACNLVYAMWRIEPESKLVVSMKSNPGQHTSAECGNRGYRNIKAAPQHARSCSALRRHTRFSSRNHCRRDESIRGQPDRLGRVSWARGRDV
jgi:hypothetical protein